MNRFQIKRILNEYFTLTRGDRSGIFVLLLLSFLLNENSDLYLWGTPKKPEDGAPPLANGGMTPEETEIFRRLNEKYQRINGGANGPQKKDEEEEEQPTMEMIYSMNMNRLMK